MAMKIKAHIKIFNDIIEIDSPISAVNTPIIMGFLTWRYIPCTTKLRVGSHGASVPFPILITVDMVIVITNKPASIRTNPVIAADKLFIETFLSMYKGTKTRALTGRMKEINCLITFFISLAGDNLNIGTGRGYIKEGLAQPA